MNISYSRETSYLRCAYSHYLGYVRRLTPVKPARPLSFGSDFHKLLELRHDKNAIKKTFKKIKNTYYDLPATSQYVLGDNYLEDIKEIFRDYRTVYKNDIMPDRTEERFEIPIGKFKGEKVIFVGVIDELYERGKSLVIGEHKTFSKKPDLSVLIMNTQKCLYAKAVQKIYGTLPDAVIWDYIKSTPAKEPIWLDKSDRFSEAKNEAITPMSWKRACKKRGITDDSILNKAEKYSGNTQNFFFKNEMDFVPEAVEKVWEGFKYVAEDILRNGETNKTMNLTRDCSWCNFYSICYAEFSGLNPEEIIKRDYKEKEDR